MKTLVLILHYNTPDLTDSLYESLFPYEGDDYDLFVLNNGSDENKKSKYPSLDTGENLYFGGGLNWAFDYILKHEQYDSLLFLNSDLILEGSGFVKTLRNEMFDNDFKIMSPSILLEHGEPCCRDWKQMQNWGSSTPREVKWIDYQCPMFSREFISHVNQFDDQLKYGWGQDVFGGHVCSEVGWKIGICDSLGIEHLGCATEFRTRTHRKIRKQQSMHMNNFFNEVGIDLIQMREWGKEYKY